jgi:hypothetical protein
MRNGGECGEQRRFVTKEACGRSRRKEKLRSVEEKGTGLDEDILVGQ